MADKCGKVLLCVRHIAAELRTTVGMTIGEDAVDCTLFVDLCTLFDCLRDGIHTANRRDDPDLIADAGSPIGTCVSIKGFANEIGMLCRIPMRCLFRFVAVFQQTAQFGLHRICMQMLTNCNIASCRADGKAVFDHVLACADRADCHLMPCGNSTLCCIGGRAECCRLPCSDI